MVLTSTCTMHAWIETSLGYKGISKSPEIFTLHSHGALNSFTVWWCGLGAWDGVRDCVDVLKTLVCLNCSLILPLPRARYVLFAWLPKAKERTPKMARDIHAGNWRICQSKPIWKDNYHLRSIPRFLVEQWNSLSVMVTLYNGQLPRSPKRNPCVSLGCQLPAGVLHVGLRW